jgi:hypothetical protein
VSDGGVGEGAVDAAVAGTEAFVVAEAFLEQRGESGLAAGEVDDLGEEFAEDGELAVGAAWGGSGRWWVGRRHRFRRLKPLIHTNGH